MGSVRISVAEWRIPLLQANEKIDDEIMAAVGEDFAWTGLAIQFLHSAAVCFAVSALVMLIKRWVAS
jgi:hypothetical protein